MHRLQVVRQDALWELRQWAFWQAAPQYETVKHREQCDSFTFAEEQ